MVPWASLHAASRHGPRCPFKVYSVCDYLHWLQEGSNTYHPLAYSHAMPQRGLMFLPTLHAHPHDVDTAAVAPYEKSEVEDEVPAAKRARGDRRDRGGAEAGLRCTSLKQYCDSYCDKS
jgi:hypothetical protein